MHASAVDETSGAYSAWGDVAFPSIFSVGSITGTSSTSGKGAAAVTKARSVVHGFSLANGLVAIDSIVTDIKATSDGNSGKTEGTTRVSGATVGMQKVTIDENGVSVSGKPTGGVAQLLDQSGKSLNDSLKQAGISIRLLKHFETKDGGLAERTATGLVIELNYNGQTAPVF